MFFDPSTEEGRRLYKRFFTLTVTDPLVYKRIQDCRKMSAIHQMWKARIHVLHKFGTSISDKVYQRSYNCQLWPARGQWSCNYRFCPFCFFKDSVKRVENMFTSWEADPSFYLYTLRFDHPFDMEVRTDVNGERLLDMDVLFKELSKFKRKFAKNTLYNSFWHCLTTIVRPDKVRIDEEPAKWVCEIRCLLLQKRPLRSKYEDKSKQLRWQPPHRRKEDWPLRMASRLSHVFTYPRVWMKCDPVVMALFVDQTRGKEFRYMSPTITSGA